MLEYSAVSVWDLIAWLAEQGASLRILIKHPASTTGDFQRTKILNSIRHLDRFVLREHRTRVQIRCYKSPASLRGKKFDDLLMDVGWYTPDLGRQGAADDDEDWEVIGHLNPLVVSSAETEEGQHLREMFDRVFESLWEAAKDNDAHEIVRAYKDDPRNH